MDSQGFRFCSRIGLVAELGDAKSGSTTLSRVIKEHGIEPVAERK